MSKIVIFGNNLQKGVSILFNISEIVEQVLICQDETSELPVAGHFSSKDILSLISRKIRIEKIYKSIFKSNPFTDFVKGHSDWKSSYADIELSFRPFSSDTPFRFMKKTEWMLVCSLAHNNSVYELIIPLHSEHSELFLFGIVALSEPGSMLEWSEAFLHIKNIETKKGNKIHLNFSANRNKLSQINRVISFRLEDAALIAFSEINRLHLAEYLKKEPTIDQNQIDLLLSWSLMQMSIRSDKANINQNSSSCLSELNFDSFSSWARNNGHKKGYCIQRIDSTQAYYPDNCIWSDIDEETALERRYYPIFGKSGYAGYRSRHSLMKENVTIKGVTRTALEWEQQSGVPAMIIESRICMGFHEDDLLLPVRKKSIELVNKMLTITGITRSAKEWAEVSGISLKTIVSRIRYGWDECDILIPPEGKGKRPRMAKNNETCQKCQEEYDKNRI